MNPRFNQTAKYFDSHTKSFDSIYSGEKNSLLRFWDKLTRQNIIQRFNYTVSEFNPIVNKKLLDVGCGTGRYCLNFSRLGAKSVLGIDISTKMIDFANSVKDKTSLSQNCTFEQSNILDVNGDFDYVSALGFFDYIDEPEVVIKYIYTLTQEKFVCSFPARISFRYPFRKLWFILHNTPIMFYSKNEIIQLLNDAGFKIKELKRIGPIYVVSAVVSLPQIISPKIK